MFTEKLDNPNAVTHSVKNLQDTLLYYLEHLSLIPFFHLCLKGKNRVLEWTVEIAVTHPIPIYTCVKFKETKNLAQDFTLWEW